jgi:hypothetical protein
MDAAGVFACPGAVSVLGLAALALACAPRPIETWRRQTSGEELRAFIGALPHCPRGNTVPSVKEIQARLWPPAACVAVRGRLFQAVLQPCPMLHTGRAGHDPDGGCVQGWALWEPSLPVPTRIGSAEERQNLTLTGGSRCEDRDAKAAGMPPATRLDHVPRLANDDVEGTRGLPQPIVVVLGTVPGQRFRPGASIELSEPIALTYLEATHMCIVDGADAGE